MQKHHFRETPKSGFIIGVNSLPIIAIKEVCFNNSMQIKKGKRDGITLFTQSKKASLAAKKELLEKIMMQHMIKSRKNMIACFFKSFMKNHLIKSMFRRNCL